MYETLCLPPSAAALEDAARRIQCGELVAFPTETVYGLGGNALDAEAVLKIFIAKNRPADNPLIAHVSAISQLEPLCEVSDDARRLMDAFWPGPLTLLLPKKDIVPAITTSGLSSVAVRMPRHPVALALIDHSGVPIAAPSANLSGRPSPTTAQHVLEDMQGRIPLILDGGACEIGVESTVLDMTGDIPTVLRPGAITADMVAGVVGQARVADSVMRALREGEAAPSPGMRHKHYAPRGSLTIVRGSADAVIHKICALYDAAPDAFILAQSPHLPAYGARRVLDMGKNAADAAHNLFAALRQMDELRVPRIFAEGWLEDGVGLALMNRMARAAAFDIVEGEDE